MSPPFRSKRDEAVLPSALAKVRALSTYLKVKPLVQQMLLLQRGVGKLVLGIVHLLKVLQDGTGLPEGQVGVGIDNGCCKKKKGR